MVGQSSARGGAAKDGQGRARDAPKGTSQAPSSSASVSADLQPQKTKRWDEPSSTQSALVRTGAPAGAPATALVETARASPRRIAPPADLAQALEAVHALIAEGALTLDHYESFKHLALEAKTWTASIGARCKAAVDELRRLHALEPQLLRAEGGVRVLDEAELREEQGRLIVGARSAAGSTKLRALCMCADMVRAPFAPPAAAPAAAPGAAPAPAAAAPAAAGSVAQPSEAAQALARAEVCERLLALWPTHRARVLGAPQWGAAALHRYGLVLSDARVLGALRVQGTLSREEYDAEAHTTLMMADRSAAVIPAVATELRALAKLEADMLLSAAEAAERKHIVLRRPVYSALGEERSQARRPPSARAAYERAVLEAISMANGVGV